ncbi:solute carrier family 35 member B1 homolog [Chironomus tepperi]|uniref:solute carrier family 35 member B1 homolog n=1 Tax=Chironomus tepperi TaxID=113505 RepID=UPI00391F1CA9
MLELHRKIKLVKISIGIIVSHIIMGIFQERIMKQPYINSDGISSQFSLPFAYVGVQCFVYTFIAVGTKLIYDREKNETPQKYFAMPAIFFVLAPVFSNMALKWVSYPTQVIGKASKPIIVMILGVLIGRKSYRAQKYVSVIFIIFGVIMFSFKPNSEESNNENLLYGNSLIGLSLLMDGFLGALQDRMRSISKPTTLNLMLFMNAWSSLYLIFPLIITNEGIDFIYFCLTHPKIIIDLSVTVTVGTIGQFFIAQMISNFGALPLSLVMTVRKFLTVFLSVIIFGNELSIIQWIAAGIIFIALVGDSMFRGKSSESNESLQETLETENDDDTNKSNLKSVIIHKHDLIESIKAIDADNNAVLEKSKCNDSTK